MKTMKSFDLVNNVETDIVPSDWGKCQREPMWIYILTTNELEREGIVKIGESRRPEIRRFQLCKANTGKPDLTPDERWFIKYKVMVPESYTGYYINSNNEYKTRISGFDHDVHSYLVKRHGIVRVKNHPKYPDNTELFRISPETAHDMICEYFGAEPDACRGHSPNCVKIVYTPADCVKTMFDQYMFRMRSGCVPPDHKMIDNFDLSRRERNDPFTVCVMMAKNAVFINAVIDRFVECTKGMKKTNIIKRCLTDNIYAYCYTENYKNAVKEQIRNHIIFELNIKMDGRIIDELVDNGNIRAIYSMEDNRNQLESKIADCIGGRFDAVVMNPPYDNGLHLKFLRKALEISDQYVLTIQPAAWLVGCQTLNDDTKAIVKAADMYHTVIDSVHGTTMFNNDAMIAGEITIDFFDKKDPDRCLIFNGNRYARCADVDLFKHPDKYVNFIKFIDELIQKNGSVESHILRSLNAKSTIFSKNPVDYDLSDAPVIRMTGFAGDKKLRSKTNGDFWTLGIGKGDGKSAKFVICRNISEFNKTNKIDDRLDVYIRFHNKSGRDNCYNYFKTDFARICVKRKKHNEHLDAGPLRYVPFFDFSDKRFSGSPADIDNTIFGMYTDWCIQHQIKPDTDNVRYYIEDELPDFYKIRK